MLENNVIYRVLDQVKEVLEEKLPPIVVAEGTGRGGSGDGF